MTFPKPVLAFVAVVVVLAGACSAGHSHTAPASTKSTVAGSSTTARPATVVTAAGRGPVPAGMRRAQRDGFSFDYPTRLQLDPVDVKEHYVIIAAYVSNEPLHDPCTRTPDSITCSRPLEHLGPSGVLVTWSEASAVGGAGNRLVDAPGTPRVVGGHDAKVTTASGPGSCPGLDAARAIDARIRIRSFANSDTTLNVEGCLGSAAASQQSALLAMIDSVRFDAEPAASSVSCGKTTPREFPAHQRAGTTHTLVPDAPIAVLACRYHGFNQPQQSGSLAASASFPSAEVMRTFAPVQLEPVGLISHCPDDSGEQDVLWFVYASGRPLLVTISVLGCRFAGNGDRFEVTPPDLQLRLAAALGSDAPSG